MAARFSVPEVVVHIAVSIPFGPAHMARPEWQYHGQLCRDYASV